MEFSILYLPLILNERSLNADRQTFPFNGQSLLTVEPGAQKATGETSKKM